MNVLNIENLKIIFESEEGYVRAVEGIDIVVKEGEKVAIVGESGCGKSVTSLACMKLLTTPPAHVLADTFAFTSHDGVTHNLMEKSENDMLALRINEMAMIFQEPVHVFESRYDHRGTAGRGVYLPQENETQRSAGKQSGNDAEGRNT